MKVDYNNIYHHTVADVFLNYYQKPYKRIVLDVKGFIDRNDIKRYGRKIIRGTAEIDEETLWIATKKEYE